MKRRVWLSLLACAALLGSPLHCLGEAMAAPAVSRASSSRVVRQRRAPEIGAKMCCHHAEALKPAAVAMTGQVRLRLVAVLKWRKPQDSSARLSAPRSLGPPGSIELAASFLSLPLLI